jgi:hypothetical protein
MFLPPKIALNIPFQLMNVDSKQKNVWSFKAELMNYMLYHHVIKIKLWAFIPIMDINFLSFFQLLTRFMLDPQHI